MTEPHTLNSRDWSFDTPQPLIRKTAKTLRIYPSTKPNSEVVGVFSRFGREMQSFEVVSHNGRLSVRPMLPNMAASARARRKPVEDQMMRKAA